MPPLPPRPDDVLHNAALDALTPAEQKQLPKHIWFGIGVGRRPVPAGDEAVIAMLSAGSDRATVLAEATRLMPDMPGVTAVDVFDFMQPPQRVAYQMQLFFVGDGGLSADDAAEAVRGIGSELARDLSGSAPGLESLLKRVAESIDSDAPPESDGAGQGGHTPWQQFPSRPSDAAVPDAAVAARVAELVAMGFEEGPGRTGVQAGIDTSLRSYAYASLHATGIIERARAAAGVGPDAPSEAVFGTSDAKLLARADELAARFGMRPQDIATLPDPFDVLARGKGNGGMETIVLPGQLDQTADALARRFLADDGRTATPGQFKRLVAKIRHKLESFVPPAPPAPPATPDPQISGADSVGERPEPPRGAGGGEGAGGEKSGAGGD